MVFAAVPPPQLTGNTQTDLRALRETAARLANSLRYSFEELEAEFITADAFANAIAQIATLADSITALESRVANLEAAQ